MDFGSKYVYAHSESAEEKISDGEIEDEMLTDLNCKDGVPPPPLPPRGIPQINQRRFVETPDHRDETRTKSPTGENKRKTHKARRPDTNIISVKFGCLTSPINMHTGDPVYCKQCKAVLSHISTISSGDTDKSWKCEFCLADNAIDIEDEEKPTLNDITFMLNPASVSNDHQMIVFCIDISGSMGVTTEVPDGLSLGSQRRNVKHVSRLQAVQAAIGSQLSDMLKENPGKRVAIVTFNNSVTFFGIEDAEDVHIAGDKLNKKEELIASGENQPLPPGLKTTFHRLIHKVYGLEEIGQTALGPALLFSVSLASQIKGSKVIICTDGKANVGLGNLETENEKASAFYQEISNLARDKGVSVSVVTFKGTDCKLIELGKVSVETGGQMNIVDPLKLKDEFHTMLADSIIATDVEATLILPRGLYFTDEDESRRQVTKKLGNVTKDSEITFRFGVTRSFGKEMASGGVQDKKDTAEASHQTAAEGASAVDADVFGNPSGLPFQLQIAYTDIGGNEALRVITETKPVTTDRKTAEKEMNAILVSVQGRRETANLALEEKYVESQTAARQYRQLLRSNVNDSVPPEVYHSYEEAESKLVKAVERVRVKPRSRCPDEAAAVFYKAKTSSSSVSARKASPASDL